MTNTIKRSFSCESGSPAIEFALLLPVLLMLLTGILDLGFMFYVQYTMNDAARAAARAYAIDSSVDVTKIPSPLPSGMKCKTTRSDPNEHGLFTVEIDCPAGSATLSGFITALTDVALIAKTTMVTEW